MIHELLKRAYTQKDWQLVADAYNQLTGKEIKVIPSQTKKKAGRPKKVKIAIPTEEEIMMVDGVEINRLEPQKEDFTIKKNEVSNQYGKPHNFIGTKNSWKDDARIEVDSFDKKVRNSKNNKPIDRREPVEYIKINCIDCEKKYDILEADIRINEEDNKRYYRCDECWVKRKYVR